MDSWNCREYGCTKPQSTCKTVASISTRWDPSWVWSESLIVMSPDIINSFLPCELSRTPWFVYRRVAGCSEKLYRAAKHRNNQLKNEPWFAAADWQDAPSAIRWFRELYRHVTIIFWKKHRSQRILSKSVSTRNTERLCNSRNQDSDGTTRNLIQKVSIVVSLSETRTGNDEGQSHLEHKPFLEDPRIFGCRKNFDGEAKSTVL